MSDRSLAIIHRPRKFEELVGQKPVAALLKAMTIKGTLPHVLLLEGCKGAGKTTTARIVASALNCESFNKPCGECESCVAIFEGNSLAVREIDASSHGLVDDIRQLQDSLLYCIPGIVSSIIVDEALALDTPIPTPEGWTTVSKVQVGEFVYSANGIATKVIRKTEVFEDKNCYTVNFMDGTSLTASANHLWETKLYGKSSTVRLRTTEELSRVRGMIQIPRASAWQAPEAALSVPPYLLGLWLGDGTSDACHINGLRGDLEFYKSELAALHIETTFLTDTPNKASRLSFAGPNGKNQGLRTVQSEKGSAKFNRPVGSTYGNVSTQDDTLISVKLRRLPCYKNKHIPTNYLRGSVKQRTELLQGLMDTDGYVGKNGHCTYVGTDEITLGVIELLNSLGQTATRHWVEDVRSRKGGYFKVEFSTRNGLVPVKLPRKVARVKDTRNSADWVSIRSVIPTSSVPVQCIEVDDPNHLFLVGSSGVVTHNCQGLSKAASNALLKTLEFPPENTVFILITTEAAKILPTIRSRCMIFSFKQISTEAVFERLKVVRDKENISLSDDIIYQAALRSGGSLRDGLILLDQLVRAGVSKIEQFQAIFGESLPGISLLKAILSGRHYLAYAEADRMLATTGNVSSVVDSLVELLKNIVVIRSGGLTSLQGEDLKQLQQISTAVDSKKAVAAMRALWDTKIKIRGNDQSPGMMYLMLTAILECLTTPVFKDSQSLTFDEMRSTLS